MMLAYHELTSKLHLEQTVTGRGAKRVAGEVDLRPSTPPTACLATRLVDSGVCVGRR